MSPAQDADTAAPSAGITSDCYVAQMQDAVTDVLDQIKS